MNFLTLQNISHQADYQFVDKLAAMAAKITKDNRRFAAYNSRSTKAIESDKEYLRKIGLTDLINKRFNCSIDLRICPDAHPHMLPPMQDLNNPLVPDYWKYFEDEMAEYGLLTKEKLKEFKGKYTVGIDLKKAQIHGDISGYPVPVFMCMPDALDLTAHEWAAVLLHEIGHAFTFIMYIAKHFLTSTVILETVKAFTEKRPHSQLVTIVDVCADELELKGVDREEVAKSDGSTFIKAALLSAARSTRNLSGTEVFDSRTSETLADQFAARMGAQEHLITALVKLYGTAPDTRSKPGDSFGKKLMLAVLSGLFWVMSRVMELLLAASIGVFGVLIILVFIFDDIRETYDPPKQRVKRIRQEIISRLKEDIDPGERARLVAMLERINDQAGIIFNGFEFVDRLLGRYMFLAFNDYPKMVNAIYQMDDLSNNELFVRASKFKTMS